MGGGRGHAAGGGRRDTRHVADRGAAGEGNRVGQRVSVRADDAAGELRVRVGVGVGGGVAALNSGPSRASRSVVAWHGMAWREGEAGCAASSSKVFGPDDCNVIFNLIKF